MVICALLEHLHPPHTQPLFLIGWGGNFEFKFCNNIEDKFSGSSAIYYAFCCSSWIFQEITNITDIFFYKLDKNTLYILT